jgi:hypothetical protein
MNTSLRIRQIASAYPGLELLDWWGYTAEAPEWVAGDGVHLSSTGAFGLADFISRSLAAMDGRPCPAPWLPGTQAADPCPAPMDELERFGGVPPVAELYGLGG